MTRRRAAAGIGVLVLVLAGCDNGGGDGGAGVASTTTPTAAVATSEPARPGPSFGPGEVMFRVDRVPLVEDGLRVLLHPAAPTVRVHVGALTPTSNAGVLVCPVPNETDAPNAFACRVADQQSDVELPLTAPLTGVEVRSLDDPPAGTRLEEVSFSYRPADRALTVVAPAMPTCRDAACEVAFSLRPTAGGTFRAEAAANAGRPRLVLETVGDEPSGTTTTSTTSTTRAGRSTSTSRDDEDEDEEDESDRDDGGSRSRVISSSEGTARLRITVDLDPAQDVVLRYSNDAVATVPPLRIDMEWP